jgi:hypothetical protein
MALIPGTRLKRLAIGLTSGLVVLPLICTGHDAARAQPAGAAWNAGAPSGPSLPPPLPQPLPQAGTLTPLCCVTAAPVPVPQAQAAPAAAAPAAAAPAAAPARRN